MALIPRIPDFQDLEIPFSCSNDKMIFLGVCQLLCGHEINCGGGEGAQEEKLPGMLEDA